MEDASPRECVTIARCYNVRKPFRDGVEVDGQWEHQYVCEGPPQYQSAGARAFPPRSSSFLYIDVLMNTVARGCHQGIDLHA